ncbi:hypothetical protein BDF14DRAFT_1724963 [Spinellus fusiger]|nr:hypothetical protein BDF14DRAFT_1724963 [Spinellus fusiger]
MFATRTASVFLLPTTVAAVYATYIRAKAQPSQAYSQIMAQGSTASAQEQWRKVNNGLGVVDVGRSCGGV